ncbi:MAG: HAMP domain-containing histidine kinase [Lachnospiraceae bacterium]|nr:HAMP domain-containing histidine kinase [Lachnospiraceae bacterium]
MRRVRKITTYFIIFGITLCFLLVGNLVLMFFISQRTGNDKAYVYAEKIAECLEQKADGEYQMSQEGIEFIHFYNGFAMLISDSGEVVWEYRLPEKLPRQYARKDIASFARWYLEDYPVITHIIGENIFVVGRQKNSIWKYQIVFSVDTIEAYLQYFPFVILVDIVILVLVPILLLRRDMRKKEQMRTTWIAGISHDIRTPLALVLGDAENIRQSCKETEPELAKRAERIENQVIRIRTLITNLNTDNKLTFGMGEWKKEEIRIAALLREVLCDMINREPGEQYEFDIMIDEEAEECMVRGDRELIKRMLENLIGNAICHNPKGCRILVRLQKDRRLIIADDGCGVSKEQLKSMRKPMFMETLGEHGLGIRLVKRIVKLHHWKIRFRQNGSSGLCCEIEMRGWRGI